MSRFQQRLESLGFETYEAYLRSDHWQVVRKHYAASDLPKRCYACRSPRYQLHHRTYKRLGAENLNDLVPLCQRCHYQVHKWLERSEGQSLWTAHKRFKNPPPPKKRAKRKREKVKAKKKRKRRPQPPRKTPMMRIKEDREETLLQVISRARVTTPTHDRFEARQKLGRLHRRAVRLGDKETQAAILNSGVRPI